MSINENFREDEIELLQEAISTQNQERLTQLSRSVYMNVRKAVARNRYTNGVLINNMAQSERASSVLYWLLRNPSCNLNKEISADDLSNKCVTCAVSELKLYSECMTCTK